MAAFTELRETVDKLTAAADAVPPSETFATSIFSAIREKKRLRRRNRFLIAAIGISSLMAAFALGLGLAPQTPEQVAPEEPVLTTYWNDIEPETPAKPKDDSPPPGPETAESPNDPPGSERIKAKEKTASTEKVERLFREIRKMEKEVSSMMGEGRKGAMRWRIAQAMELGRSMSVSELQGLVKRLEADPVDASVPSQTRVRRMVLLRLKMVIDNKLNPNGHGSRRGRPK
jgi:hypothetical protein